MHLVEPEYALDVGQSSSMTRVQLMNRHRFCTLVSIPQPLPCPCVGQLQGLVRNQSGSQLFTVTSIDPKLIYLIGSTNLHPSYCWPNRLYSSLMGQHNSDLYHSSLRILSYLLRFYEYTPANSHLEGKGIW